MKIGSDLTIVIISYNSEKKVFQLLKKIKKDFKCLIVDNSNSKHFKKKIEKSYNQIKVLLQKNIGYGAAINFAKKFIKTKYFLVLNPDIENLNKNKILKFIKYAKKLNDNFSCLGPRYINISPKTLMQSQIEYKIAKMKSISGAVMFFNIDRFSEIKGFDESFFLYFEETDYCFRGNRIGLNCFQINTIKIKHNVGTSIEFKDQIFKKKIKDLQSWHFIWSKFYFYKKRYGITLSTIYFTPLLIRILTKMLIFTLFNNKDKLHKYTNRLDGLMASFKGNPSYKRI